MLNLILTAIVVGGLLPVFVPLFVLVWVSPPADPLSLKLMLAVFLLSCVASVPILYAIGYFTWGGIRMSLATVRHELRFRHCLSGWGHGWKMCWTALVQLTYVQLWLLLFIVPGIVKSFSYAMTPYLQVDHPDWTATRCITESRRLMNGNKWRFLCLNFSFIGWWTLAVAALLVPFLGGLAQYLLMPYFSTSVARFYEEVKEISSICS